MDSFYDLLVKDKNFLKIISGDISLFGECSDNVTKETKSTYFLKYYALSEEIIFTSLSVIFKEGKLFKIIGSTKNLDVFNNEVLKFEFDSNPNYNLNRIYEKAGHPRRYYLWKYLNFKVKIVLRLFNDHVYISMTYHENPSKLFQPSK